MCKEINSNVESGIGRSLDATFHELLDHSHVHSIPKQPGREGKEGGQRATTRRLGLVDSLWCQWAVIFVPHQLCACMAMVLHGTLVSPAANSATTPSFTVAVRPPCVSSSPLIVSFALTDRRLPRHRSLLALRRSEIPSHAPCTISIQKSPAQVAVQLYRHATSHTPRSTASHAAPVGSASAPTGRPPGQCWRASRLCRRE